MDNLELEKLNTETAEINKLELELEDGNTTFRMLLNEATRRLKGLAHRLGSSVEKARPYHEAAAAAQDARAACQRAAVSYQRASEIHAAAKETVALAEQRFQSNQHEWQFDNAWQEMLNHATIKVMDAETKKAESGREHQKRAHMFNAAETKVQQLEDQLKKHVIKSRPYFDEKQLCQEQLATQKERIEYLQELISKAKFRYSQSLKTLEKISEEIHMKRRDMYGDVIGECPVGPREPGVGAENYTDYSLELERHDLGLRSSSLDSDGNISDETGTLEELRRRVRRLAARPVEGGAISDIAWETELNETVNRLDQMLMMREKAQNCKSKSHSIYSCSSQHSDAAETLSANTTHSMCEHSTSLNPDSSLDFISSEPVNIFKSSDYEFIQKNDGINTTCAYFEGNASSSSANENSLCDATEIETTSDVLLSNTVENIETFDITDKRSSVEDDFMQCKDKTVCDNENNLYNKIDTTSDMKDGPSISDCEIENILCDKVDIIPNMKDGQSISDCEVDDISSNKIDVSSNMNDDKVALIVKSENNNIDQTEKDSSVSESKNSSSDETEINVMKDLINNFAASENEKETQPLESTILKPSIDNNSTESISILDTLDFKITNAGHEEFNASKEDLVNDKSQANPQETCNSLLQFQPIPYKISFDEPYETPIENKSEDTECTSSTAKNETVNAENREPCS